jgi:hypothetical protein
MDADHTNKWLTLTANVGVILSLLFLAYEINQSTKATIAAASQGLTDQSILYFDAQLDHEAISQAVYKHHQDDELSGYELHQLDLLQRMNFRVFENAFLQYKRGLYEEREWDRYRRIIAGHMADNPIAIQMWERTQGSWTDEFAAEVESLR